MFQYSYVMKAHCTHCGSKFVEQEFPKFCYVCENITWGNPVPVVNVLQPVYSSTLNRTGLAMARRAIAPCIGEWSLVGGYVNHDDFCLITAAQREFQEETSIDIGTDGKIVHSQLNAHGNMIVTVAMNNPVDMHDFMSGLPCEENYELGVLWSGDESKLCFPIHRAVAEVWFSGGYQ